MLQFAACSVIHRRPVVGLFAHLEHMRHDVIRPRVERIQAERRSGRLLGTFVVAVLDESERMHREQRVIAGQVVRPRRQHCRYAIAQARRRRRGSSRTRAPPAARARRAAACAAGRRATPGRDRVVGQHGGERGAGARARAHWPAARRPAPPPCAPNRTRAGRGCTRAARPAARAPSRSLAPAAIASFDLCVGAGAPALEVGERAFVGRERGGRGAGDAEFRPCRAVS